jgi:phage shock protein E
MPEVTALDAKKIIDSGSQLIDVRTEAEYEAGHVPGARHVPLADVQRESSGLAKDQPVILYCRSGNRSGPAAEAFAASGWDA